MPEFKCPRCGQEYGLAEDRPGNALGWLCAACWQEKRFDDKKMEQEPELRNAL